MRRTSIWILSLFAGFHFLTILLQSDNLSTLKDPQSTYYDIRDWINVTLRNITVKFEEDIYLDEYDTITTSTATSTYSGSTIHESPIPSFGSSKMDVDQTNEFTEQTWSENSLDIKKEVVRTPDIPYERFLHPPKMSVIANDLTENSHNINFLKNMPNDEEMSHSMRPVSEFGHPNEMDCDDSYCYVNGRTIKREIIKENPEDMFTFLPPEEKFLKEFKNPCWKGEDIFDRESLFCIPYFFIIGFTKCGTTDLYGILNSHVLISSRFLKETHYFDRRRRGRAFTMHRPVVNAPPVSFMNYATKGSYRKKLMKTYQRIDGTDVLFHGITMDATPSHVWDNEYWEAFYPGFKEPPVTNADTIAAINPKTKIIFSLRDPISRMKSAYQFFCSIRGPYPCDRPITPEKYHNLVVEAVERFNSCLKNNTVRGCTYSTDTHQLATHLYASIYHVYIIDFMKVFPRDQLYFLKMEDHVSNLVTSTSQVVDFLDVPPFPEDVLRRFQERTKVRNMLKDEKRLPYVLPETVQILEEFFKPYLRDLVDLLGDEKWYWDRPR